MASFRILKLVCGNNEYILSERTGLYKTAQQEENESIGLYDLILKDKCIITSIRSEVGIELSIGTQFVIGNSKEPKTVKSFKSIKNRIYINEDIELNIVKLYIKPIETKQINVGFIEELQEKILKNNVLLKLGTKQNLFVHKLTTVGEFIDLFIKQYNRDFETTYATSDRIQTEAGKRRSLADIYMICRNYFPNCTLREVIKALYIDIPASNKLLGSLICKQINKRVWWLFHKERFDEKESKDEYGYTYNDYVNEIKNPAKPKVEESKLNNTDKDLLTKIQGIYKKGIKVKSLVDGKQFVVDSDHFYDGIRTVLLIQKNGSRKVIFDKNKNKQAEIVK